MLRICNWCGNTLTLLARFADVVWFYLHVIESLVTLDILKWFLPSVSSLMSYKITLRIESLVTLAALARFVSGVYHIKIAQCLCHTASVSWELVGPIPSHQMSLQSTAYSLQSDSSME